MNETQVLFNPQNALHQLLSMRDKPELVQNAQIVITLTANDLIEWSNMMQQLTESRMERMFERLRRDDVRIKYATTNEIKKDYGISRSHLYTLLHEGVLSDPIKIGRENAFSRKEIKDYLSGAKRPGNFHKVSPR